MLAAAEPGEGGLLLLLAGEAGVGKTRLAEAAFAASGMASCTGWPRMRGRAAMQRPRASFATIYGGIRRGWTARDR
jgi:hypothetical protein